MGETYTFWLWIGDGASENVQDQMIEYAEKMQQYVDDTLWQLDTGWSNREVVSNGIVEQGLEPSDFTQYFPNGLSYDNAEWTPQCSVYKIPTLESYIVEYNDSSHIVIDDVTDVTMTTTSDTDEEELNSQEGEESGESGSHKIGLSAG